MTPESWWSHALPVVAAVAAPLLLVALTAFSKTAVLLSILKNAIGGTEVIPTAVVMGVALVLTVFIMMPVGTRVAQAVAAVPEAQRDPVTLAGAAAGPIEHFLDKNADKEEVAFFSNLANSSGTPRSRFAVLAAAFTSSELLEALHMGVLLLVPFVVVDLLLSVAVTATGLSTVPVSLVALPCKLLIFLAADGWHLLIDALVTSYAV